MEQGDVCDDYSINIWMFVDFLLDHAKVLLLCGSTAALVGLAGWSLTSPWKRELLLNVERSSNGWGNADKPGTERRSSVPSIDLLTWRRLSQDLPLLAQHLYELDVAAAGEPAAGYKVLARPQWWERNAVPNFALTKADTRNLVSVSKQLQDSGSETILSISLFDEGRDRDAVGRQLNLAADFFRQGAAYLAAKDLLAGYRFQLSGVADIQRRVVENEVELKYLYARAKKLEGLRVRFPHGDAVYSKQVMEINDYNAKYMPVDTQLISTYSDIERMEEESQRLKNSMEQLGLKEEFLKAAQPLLESQFNGFELIARLIQIESDLRNKSDVTKEYLLLELEKIRQELTALQSRFSLGLVKNPPSQPFRSGPFLPLAVGFIAGTLLMLAWLLVSRGWRNHIRAEA